MALLPLLPLFLLLHANLNPTVVDAATTARGAVPFVRNCTGFLELTNGWWTPQLYPPFVTEFVEGEWLQRGNSPYDENHPLPRGLDLSAAKFFPCFSASMCTVNEHGAQCSEGHKGPLCNVCEDQLFHHPFAGALGGAFECRDCLTVATPLFVSLALQGLLLVGAGLLVAGPLARYVRRHAPLLLAHALDRAKEHDRKAAAARGAMLRRRRVQRQRTAHPGGGLAVGGGRKRLGKGGTIQRTQSASQLQDQAKHFLKQAERERKQQHGTKHDDHHHHHVHLKHHHRHFSYTERLRRTILADAFPGHLVRLSAEFLQVVWHLYDGLARSVPCVAWPKGLATLLSFGAAAAVDLFRALPLACFTAMDPEQKKKLGTSARDTRWTYYDTFYATALLPLMTALLALVWHGFLLPMRISFTVASRRDDIYEGVSADLEQLAKFGPGNAERLKKKAKAVKAVESGERSKRSRKKKDGSGRRKKKKDGSGRRKRKKSKKKGKKRSSSSASLGDDDGAAGPPGPAGDPSSSHVNGGGSGSDSSDPRAHAMRVTPLGDSDYHSDSDGGSDSDSSSSSGCERGPEGPAGMRGTLSGGGAMAPGGTLTPAERREREAEREAKVLELGSELSIGGGCKMFNYLPVVILLQRTFLD